MAGEATPGVGERAGGAFAEPQRGGDLRPGERRVTAVILRLRAGEICAIVGPPSNSSSTSGRRAGVES